VSEDNPIRLFVSHLFEEDVDYLRVFEFLESVDRFSTSTAAIRTECRIPAVSTP